MQRVKEVLREGGPRREETPYIRTGSKNEFKAEQVMKSESAKHREYGQTKTRRGEQNGNKEPFSVFLYTPN